MEKQVGIYVHIPFCLSKCAYCNFYSLAGGDKLIPAYHSAVIRHIKEYSPQLDGYLIDTVYFGGGTPNHYGVGRLLSIFNALKKHGHVLLDSEVTVEINPKGVTKEELVRLRRAGFNRLSIGVQCADDKTLKSLGRSHTFSDAEETVEDAREAGFDNLSVDIIYGFPSQNKDAWAETVAKATALKPEHISCYGLKIEEGTQLYIFKDSPFLPSDDAQADMYLYTVETLARFGYRQYEISNFARRGFESKHNLKYWLGEEYIGFGPGAHSYFGRGRYSFIEDVGKYIERVESGQQSIVEYREEMSDFENAGEYLILRLRTTHGISEEEYYNIYRLKMDYVLELMQKYEENGWAQYIDGRWRFTPKGFVISNALLGELLEAQTKQRTQVTKPWQKQLVEEDEQMDLFDKRPLSIDLFGGRRLAGADDQEQHQQEELQEQQKKEAQQPGHQPEQQQKLDEQEREQPQPQEQEQEQEQPQPQEQEREREQQQDSESGKQPEQEPEPEPEQQQEHEQQKEPEPGHQQEQEPEPEHQPEQQQEPEPEQQEEESEQQDPESEQQN